MIDISVAIIEPIGAHGGNDIYDINLVRSICSLKGNEAVLYTCDSIQTDELKFVKLFYKNIYGKKNKVVRALNYIKGTFCSLLDAKKKRVSIVHLHFFDFSLLEFVNLYMAKRLFRFPVVGTVHDVESFSKFAKGDSSKQKYDMFLSLLDWVVTHTEYARRELMKNIKPEEIYYKKISTIYAGDFDYDKIDDSYIEKKRSRKNISLPKNRKIILFFGMIKKVKGLDVLLKSISILSKCEPKVLLVIAGKVWKDDFTEYEKIIRQHGLESFVDTRIGFIKNEEVPYYFNAADVIALPYRKIYNSGVLIRAMSFGVPIIASNFGPFEEFIQDGKNGFLFEKENPDSLAEKLKITLSEKINLHNVGIEAKVFIKSNFALEKIGRQYCEIYKNILSEYK